MTRGLHIAPGLDLPIEAVTETFAILAKRGKGKTNTAVVMAEEMIAAGLPVVVLDPVGVWWGLRSTADGKGAGLPVVIFGGDHHDLPLEEGAGELIADVIVDNRMSAVIDLSSLSKSASRRFMAPFVERLYRRNREALHVIVDEADAFAPQRTHGDGARLLGAMEDLVRRGRARGIGVTLITQRPAVLNKDVLTQAEVLIALGMTGPRDVQAIDEWVKLHADEDQAREVKASLPSLQVGDAWVWSPGWLDILQRVHIRARTTFDSSATPKPGEKRVAPQRMANVDLDALGAKISATREHAKADDPKVLRAEIAQLRKALGDVPAPQPVEVKVPDEALVVGLRQSLGEVVEVLDSLQATLGKIVGLTDVALASVRESVPAARPPGPRLRRSEPSTPLTPPLSVPVAVRLDDSDVRLGKTERSILTVLAQHGPRTHSQIALLAGYSPKASTIGVALGKLRKVGYVEAGQPVTATQAGIDYLGDNVEPLPQGDALLNFWRNRFGLTEQRVLDVLIDRWPDETSQTDIADVTGYSRTASTIGVALGRLRKVEVVKGWRLSEDFAEAAGLA